MWAPQKSGRNNEQQLAESGRGRFPAWAWATLTLITTLSTVAGLFLLQLQCSPPQALLPKCGSTGREHPCHLQGEDTSLKPGGMQMVERRRGGNPRAAEAASGPFSSC